MAENQKNLCAMIPEELHSRVRAAQEQAGVTLSAYITGLLTDYYEGGKEKMEKGMRTMAFQMPEELFQRLKGYLERESTRTGKKLTQKEFVLGLIRQTLDEAERREADAGALDGKKVLMLDTDPQGDLTKMLGQRKPHDQRQLHQLELDAEHRCVIRRQQKYDRRSPRTALCAPVSTLAAPDRKSVV